MVGPDQRNVRATRRERRGDITQPARVATGRSFAYQTPRSYSFSASIDF